MSWGVALMNLQVRQIHNVFPDPPKPCPLVPEDDEVPELPKAANKFALPVAERIRRASAASAANRLKKKNELCANVFAWISVNRAKDVRDISNQFGISMNYSRKITTTLKQQGKIESFKGNCRWSKFRVANTQRK